MLQRNFYLELLLHIFMVRHSICLEVIGCCNRSTNSDLMAKYIVGRFIKAQKRHHQISDNALAIINNHYNHLAKLFRIMLLELLLADPVDPAPLLLPVPLVALLPLVPPKFGVLVDSKSSCTGDSACDESLKLRGPRGTNIEFVPAPVLPPFTVDEIDVCPLEPSKLATLSMSRSDFCTQSQVLLIIRYQRLGLENKKVSYSLFQNLVTCGLSYSCGDYSQFGLSRI
uniref:Uncharacterized protein n=1 Tax=Glossina pallidipes TaxID=7398 RepID=A0A1B0A2P2_GLOPL